MHRRILVLWLLLLTACVAQLPVATTTPGTATDTPATPTNPSEPTATSAPEAAAPSATPAATSAAQVVPTGGELLLLSGGDLVGVAITDGSRRTILSGVTAFRAAPDGQTIAAIRGSGATGELWLVRRDATDAHQLTDDNRSLATLAWFPDSSGFVYAASSADSGQQTTWLEWAAFCRESTVVARTLTAPQEVALGEGCDPAISPDGKRIAYASRPTRSDPSAADPGFTAGNTIHLINAAGQNGWDPVRATGGETGQPGQGMVAYLPSWSADGSALYVNLFIGMRVETDINLLVRVDAHDATSQLLDSTAGWQRSVSAAPDNTRYLVTTQNVGNARGSTGWDVWQAAFATTSGSRDVYLPDGSFPAVGSPLGEVLHRAQHSAWNPSGTAVAVVLPPEWNAGIAPNEDYGHVGEPGEVWLWEPGGVPAQKITAPVDDGSPIQWLP